MNRIPTTIAILSYALLITLPIGAMAAEEQRWALCPPIIDQRAAELPPLPSLASGTTQLSADEILSEADGTIRLNGSVVIQRDGANLFGQHASYNRTDDHLTLKGDVSYRSEGLSVDGEEAQLWLSRASGTFSEARFFFPANHGFGYAKEVTIRAAEQAFLKGLRYTTCNPDSPDWQLKASSLELDQASNTGEAWHARLSFMGVPFFYSPYLNFPLQGRKSGILPPTIGSSDERGSDVSLPLYWNIAPNQDATLTPRHIGKRGTMLSAEYRFLGENSYGQLNGSHLGDDELYGDDRHYYSLSHAARFGHGWHSNLDYRQVSDNDYFRDDLGDGAEGGSQTHLLRRADFGYIGRHWRFLTRVQDYQTLSGTAPYRLLPQLRLEGRSAPRKNRLNLSLKAEAVSFDHDDEVPTGKRLDLKPSLSLPWGSAGWFLTPKLAWRHTQYQLENHSAGERLERSLPIASLDGGLFFERALTVAKTPYVQTLEPRLFYLQVPYEAQDDLPLFDTDERDFSFSQLFSDNRFGGPDRQGDTEQLSLALTSRLIQGHSGREILSGSIGQIHYYREREVTLYEDDPIGERESSDLIGELSLSPSPALRFSVTEQWNPETEEIERLNTRVRFSPGKRKLINLTYRYRREEPLQQSDLALLWPLNRQWRFVGRYRYDLENELALDTLGGLEYESCCWSMQVIARSQRDSIWDEANQSIHFTLQLKGLASLGRGIEESLGHGILED